MKNEVLEALIEDLTTNPWYVCSSKCTLGNTRNHVRVWIANVPVLDTNVYEPCPLKLSLWEKFRLYDAVKIAKNNAVMRELKK